ncbi:MAG: hypothetical protein KAU58_03380, partial [Candidatus Omnitrophica bacterium]|nr:hypothetical protein [Candidatus Omnitrophota bacterium]
MHYNLEHFRNKKIVKILSIILLQAFLFYNISFATLEETLSLPDKDASTCKASTENVTISKDIGSIKSRYEGKGEKLIIHIQDAHCNYEAQINIAKIIKGLIRQYNIDFVAVEGADGVVDTSWFKAFPDNEIRKEVADYFMKKGEITGAEFLSITSDYPFTIYGAENRKYYIKNLNSFLETHPYKDEFLKYYASVKTVLNKLKRFIYTKELIHLDRKITRHKNKEIKFSDYAEYLKKIAESKNIGISKYENFKVLSETLKYEKNIDFDVVNEERANLIDELSKKLPKDKLAKLVNKSVAFKLGKIESNSFYSYLTKVAGENDISLAKKYNNLTRYIIYARIYSKINTEKLFDEIDLLTTSLKEKMFVNDDQEELDRLWANVNIIVGFMNIELTNKEYEYYLANKEEFVPDKFNNFIEKNSSRFGLAYDIGKTPLELNHIFPKLVDFYEIALKRDNMLIKNMFKGMRGKKTDIAILVTGGFHTKGITNLLKQQDVSYIVINPSITKEAESPYISVLTGQKTPFEKLLIKTIETEKSELATPSKLCELCRRREIKGEDLKERGYEFLDNIAAILVKMYIRAYPDKPKAGVKKVLIDTFKTNAKHCANKKGSEYILARINKNFDSIYDKSIQGALTVTGEDVREKAVGATLGDAAIDEVIHNCYEEGRVLAIFRNGQVPDNIKNNPVYANYATLPGMLMQRIQELDDSIFQEILNHPLINASADSPLAKAFTKENLLRALKGTLESGSGFEIVLVQPKDEVQGVRVPGILMTRMGSNFGHYSTKRNRIYIPHGVVDILQAARSDDARNQTIALPLHELAEYAILKVAFQGKVVLEHIQDTGREAHFIAQLLERAIAGPSAKDKESVLGPRSALDDALENITGDYFRSLTHAKEKKGEMLDFNTFLQSLELAKIRFYNTQILLGYNVKAFTEAMPGLYESANDILRSRYPRAGDLLNILGSIEDPGERQHDMPGFMGIMEKLQSELTSEQYRNSLVLAITDGGSKTRFGYKILSEGYAGLLRLPGNRIANMRELAALTLIATMDYLPGGIMRFVGWNASDNFAILGNASIGNITLNNWEALDEKLSDAAVVKGGVKVQLFDENTARVINGLGENTTLKEIEGAIGKEKMANIILTIEEEHLEELGALAVNKDGKLTAFIEKEKDRAKLIRLYAKHGGELYKNPFLELLDKDFALMLFNKLRQTPAVSPGIGTLD